MQKSTSLSWDDLRFLVALADAGSLSATARALGVDHTTVGRRVEAAEAALGLRLFTRSASGYALTLDGARLLPAMHEVEAAVQRLRRAAEAGEGAIEGTLRVTSPETLGVTWLSAQLSAFADQHPGVSLEIDPSGALLDLERGEAEVAIRNVAATQQRLIVQRVAELGYGLYATPRTLARHPVRCAADLKAHRLLSTPRGSRCVESRWIERLAPKAPLALVSELSVALMTAAKAHAGVAVLPRYLGDAAPELRHIPMPEEPAETLWLTLHEDARAIPRVRALVDFLKQAFAEHAAALRGAPGRGG